MAVPKLHNILHMKRERLEKFGIFGLIGFSFFNNRLNKHKTDKTQTCGLIDLELLIREIQILNFCFGSEIDI